MAVWIVVLRPLWVVVFPCWFRRMLVARKAKVCSQLPVAREDWRLFEALVNEAWSRVAKNGFIRVFTVVCMLGKEAHLGDSKGVIGEWGERKEMRYYHDMAKKSWAGHRKKNCEGFLVLLALYYSSSRH